MRWHSSTIGSSAAPAKIDCSGARICVFHEARRRVVLQQREDAARRLARPRAGRGRRASRATARRTSRSSASACCTRSSSSSADGDLAGVVALAERQRCRRAKNASSRVDQRQLVAQAELDVDALDALGVLAHPRQRDDDVLVDLEGVGVLADRRGALAVEPELLARLGADGDEALAARGRWRCARPRWWRAPPRRRRRRRCRRPAPSSAGRRACSWWRSRPPCR